MRGFLSAILGLWLAAAASAQTAPAAEAFPPEIRAPTPVEARKIDAGLRMVLFADNSAFPQNTLKNIEAIEPLVKETYGPAHPYMLRLGTLRANSLARLRKHNEAEALFADNLPAIEKRVGADKAFAYDARRFRATNLIQLGRLAEAARLIEQSEAIATAAKFSPLERAGSSLDLAFLRRTQGRFLEAEAQARQALDALLAAPKPEAAAIAIARASLARALTGIGRTDEALKLVFDGLAAHAPEDVARARLLFALGEALSEAGRPVDAQKAFKDAALLLDKTEGFEHPNTLQATVRTRLEALKLFGASPAITSSFLSDGLPIIGSIGPCEEGVVSLTDADVAMLNALGQFRGENRRDCLVKARAFLKTGLGDDAPATLAVREMLADTLDTIGDSEPALEEARALLVARERVNGANAPATARAALLYGRSLAALGRGSEASAMFARAAAILPIEAEAFEARRLDATGAHEAAALAWQRAVTAFDAGTKQQIPIAIQILAGRVFNAHYQGRCAEDVRKSLSELIAAPAYVLLGPVKTPTDEANAILLGCAGKWDEADTAYRTLSFTSVSDAIVFQDANLAQMDARRALLFARNPKTADTAFSAVRNAVFLARERRYTPDRDAKGKPLGFRRESATSGTDPLAIVFATQIKIDWEFDGKTITHRGAYQEQGTGKFIENNYDVVHQGMDSAFRAAQDFAQSQAAASLLETAARAAVSDPELRALIDRQAMLAERIARADRPAAAEPDRKALADATAALRQKFPAYANTARPFGLSVEDTRKRLRPGEAVLMIQAVGADVYSFAVSDAAFKWSKAKIGRAEMDRLVAMVRCRIDTESCRLDLPGDRLFESEAAARLYRELVAPVVPGFGDATVLYTVTGGTLGSIPLGILVTGNPAPAAKDDVAELAGLAKTQWLADAYALATLPSVSSLRAYQGARERLSHGSFAGVGDPVLGPPAEATRGMTRPSAGALRGGGGLFEPAALRTLSSLPGTRRELTAIAASLGAPSDRLMLGAAARESAVKSSAALASARIVAFATHALLPEEFKGNVEPGLVFTPPDRATPEDDGYLTASEAAALKLDADWVLLSACNTAGPAEGGSNESLSGLARAFLFAGARSLLVSHWPVEDSVGAAITSETFRIAAAKPELSRAEALRQALRGIRSGQSALGGAISGWKPAWADPWAWAPFSLVESGS